jgi:hypothetical protein
MLSISTIPSINTGGFQLGRPTGKTDFGAPILQGLRQIAGKTVFIRLLKNAHIQGARNPEK